MSPNDFTGVRVDRLVLRGEVGDIDSEQLQEQLRAHVGSVRVAEAVARAVHDAVRNAGGAP